MLLRNLDVPRGLCNGTRLQIMKQSKYNLYCRILTGPRASLNEIHIIPQIKLEYGQNSQERGLHFRRLQFPVKPCFAMTINKVTLLFFDLCLFNLFRLGAGANTATRRTRAYRPPMLFAWPVIRGPLSRHFNGGHSDLLAEHL